MLLLHLPKSSTVGEWILIDILLVFDLDPFNIIKSILFFSVLSVNFILHRGVIIILRMLYNLFVEWRFNVYMNPLR